jgi:hypothetical protein
MSRYGTLRPLHPPHLGWAESQRVRAKARRERRDPGPVAIARHLGQTVVTRDKTNLGGARDLSLAGSASAPIVEDEIQ